MSNFKSALPLAVSGKSYRLRLDHPEIEAIGARMERLYQRALLPDDERGETLKLYKSLSSADRFFANAYGDHPLPKTRIRPKFVTDSRRPSSEYFGAPDHEVRAGFIWRVLEYVERLEQQYLGTQADADAI